MCDDGKMVLETATRWQQVLLASSISWKAHDRIYVRPTETAQQRNSVLQYHRVST
jgi:hypothetical protein